MVQMTRREILRCGCIAATAALTSNIETRMQPALGQTPNQPTTLQGIGPYPLAVAVGNQGAIYVADHELKVVYRLEEGNKLATVYKGSRKYRTPLYRVFAIAQDSTGNLFFCDTGSMDVWRMTPDGKLSPLSGQKIARGIGAAPANQDFDPEAAYSGDFDKPMGIVVEPEGSLVVTDLAAGGTVYRIAASGGKPQEIARVPAPHGIALDGDGGFVVVSQGKDQLVHVSPKGDVTPIVKGALAPKNNPHYVVADSNGYYVTDNYAAAVWQVSRDGKVKALVQGEPLVKPVGLAQEAGGNLLVADPWARKLFRVTLDGQISTVVSFDNP